MSEREKDAGRRDGAGDRASASRKADKRERARSPQAEGTPFNGTLHSDHPHDPFRKPFSGSSLKFEF
jgi:hypothetical protein